MSQLTLPDVDDAVIQRLQQQAAAHGRTVGEEASAILKEALQLPDPWGAVDAIRDRLAATGKKHSDSTELVREDRAR